MQSGAAPGRATEASQGDSRALRPEEHTITRAGQACSVLALGRSDELRHANIGAASPEARQPA